MYESKAILKYLFNTYGPGEKEIPFLMLDGVIPTGSSRLGNNFILFLKFIFTYSYTCLLMSI